MRKHTVIMWPSELALIVELSKAQHAILDNAIASRNRVGLPILLALLLALMGAIAVSGTAYAGCPPEEPCHHYPTNKTLGFEFQTQEDPDWCGPAATRIALTARGYPYSQDHLANELETKTYHQTVSFTYVTRELNQWGYYNWYEDKEIGGSSATQAQIDQLKRDVRLDIYKGFAIVANVVGTGTDLNGRSRTYNRGHFLTVVGYENLGEISVIADPADIWDPDHGHGLYRMYTWKLAHWIAERGYSA